MEATGATTVRPRKACIQCYQKKVRCDFSTDLASCSRCRNLDLECALPEGAQTTSRSSIRQASGFEELSSRVQNLEQILLLGQDSSITPFEDTTVSEANRARSPLSSRQRDPVNIVSSPGPSRVSLYRGKTSPWSTLVNRLDSETGSKQMNSFQETVARLASEERSADLTGSRISFNFLQAFPGLQQDDILGLIKTYAIEAPFPILHYHSLIESTFRILHTQSAECWGQVICILLYMAFGVARTYKVESSISPEQHSGIYMQRAWDKLPNLIIDHNLWSLKALTLMVHYLQASSKPEPCWALLGTASRMAISLGFHQKGHKVDSYSVVEMEEGRRAWWLCYIMEKTFCTTFGYPSLTAASRETFDAEYPAVFKQTATFSEETPEEIAIFGQNEIEAVAFFKDLIKLTHSREDALSSSNKAGLDVEPMKALLPRTLRDYMEGQFALSSGQNLRTSIRDLARYSAIQVISMHASPHSPLPRESLVSARSSIQIILETKTAGTTMCLWMWLYYAFTAVVTLFLQILTAPLHTDAMLDLALLSDLQALCEPLAESSAGAKRVMDIILQMEKVALEVMKRAARTKAGKRAAMDEVSTEVGRQKIQKKVGEFEGNSELIGQSRSQDSGALPKELEVENALEDSAAAEIVLPSTPQTFQWDQWDQWLNDVPFELE